MIYLQFEFVCVSVYNKVCELIFTLNFFYSAKSILWDISLYKRSYYKEGVENLQNLAN